MFKNRNKEMTVMTEIKEQLNRREVLGLIGSGAAAFSISSLAGAAPSLAGPLTKTAGSEDQVQPKAFVYTELQNSVEFDRVPWKKLNKQIARQAGLLNKTWLSGVGTYSLGGIYSFDSIENAQKYCTEFFPAVARDLGVAQTTRIFDGSLVSEASVDIGSPHFGVKPTSEPGAYVYTEVQVSVPFEKAPWKARNPVLKRQKGLISKLWLSGLHTQTIGGIDAFDSVENATDFAINSFPKTAKKLNAAFYTRVFDAKATALASRDLNSPYYL